MTCKIFRLSNSCQGKANQTPQKLRNDALETKNQYSLDIKPDHIMTITMPSIGKIGKTWPPLIIWWALQLKKL